MDIDNPEVLMVLDQKAHFTAECVAYEMTRMSILMKLELARIKHAKFRVDKDRLLKSLELFQAQLAEGSVVIGHIINDVKGESKWIELMQNS